MKPGLRLILISGGGGNALSACQRCRKDWSYFQLIFSSVSSETSRSVLKGFKLFYSFQKFPRGYANISENFVDCSSLSGYLHLPLPAIEEKLSWTRRKLIEG